MRVGVRPRENFSSRRVKKFGLQVQVRTNFTSGTMWVSFGVRNMFSTTRVIRKRVTSTESGVRTRLVRRLSPGQLRPGVEWVLPIWKGARGTSPEGGS